MAILGLLMKIIMVLQVCYFGHGGLDSLLDVPNFAGDG